MISEQLAREIADDHFLAALLRAQGLWLATHDRAALRRELLSLLLQLE